MDSSPPLNKKRISSLVLFFGLSMILMGFFVSSPSGIFSGIWRIITSPGILITDYIALAGLGPTLVNVGLVTFMGLGLACLINACFNGYFLAGIFTLAGFAFFGKNPFNILPIFLGVYLYDRFFTDLKMKDLIAPLLFGTTLGPVVGQIAFGFGQGWQWVALISPVFVTLLLTRVSGVPLLEKKADEKWGGQKEYEAYKKSTPVLIPRIK